MVLGRGSKDRRDGTRHCLMETSHRLLVGLPQSLNLRLVSSQLHLEGFLVLVLKPLSCCSSLPDFRLQTLLISILDFDTFDDTRLFVRLRFGGDGFEFLVALIPFGNKQRVCFLQFGPFIGELFFVTS